MKQIITAVEKERPGTKWFYAFDDDLHFISPMYVINTHSQHQFLPDRQDAHEFDEASEAYSMLEKVLKLHPSDTTYQIENVG